MTLTLFECGTSLKNAKSPAGHTQSHQTVISIAQKRWPDVTVESLQAGQEIYNTTCTKCHDAYDIKDYSEDDWLPLIDKMSRKAKLSDADKETVKRYILSVREALVDSE